MSEKLLGKEEIAVVAEVMGNKNNIPLKGPDTETTHEQDGVCIDSVAGKTLYFLTFIQPLCAFHVYTPQCLSLKGSLSSLKQPQTDFTDLITISRDTVER